MEMGPLQAPLRAQVTPSPKNGLLWVTLAGSAGGSLLFNAYLLKESSVPPVLSSLKSVLLRP